MFYLKYWRQREGLTQEKLAEKAGFHLNTINRWERGHREPRTSDIAKLCRALKVSEAELLNGPPRTELIVNFFWECEDMDMMNIKSNEFSLGYRNDGMLIVAGAIPWDISIDDILSRIKAELVAAKEGKKARDDALKRELGEEAVRDDRQSPDDGQNQSAPEGA